MRKLMGGLIILLVFLPGISFAQTSALTKPTPPASWAAFQKESEDRREAFRQQQKALRAAFLKANPDAQAYLDQLKAWHQRQIKAHQSQPATKAP